MRPQIDNHEIEQQVVFFMESNGITPPRDRLILDGKMHRYPVEADKHGGKSGVYCIHADNWPAGWVQDFHIGEPIRWKFDTSKLDSGTREGWRRYQSSDAYRQAEQDRRDREADEKKKLKEERINRIRATWSVYRKGRSVEEATCHPYLSAKHCQPRGGFFFCDIWCGLRVGSMVSSSGKALNNLLLIPMLDLTTNKFCGVHRIFGWPGRDGKYSKGWCCSAGGVYSVAIDARYGPVVVAEGISTGLSLYDVFVDELNEPETTVIVCCDAGNLIKQAPVIRSKFPDRELLIAADDDEAGRKASDFCMSAGFNATFSFREVA